ncbi:MAG: hypothetical protein HQM10_00685 [Candidatus Riflebacteria bacterium]|nr:hypothetical protein [Candidatus Riflebacteria bacterium]
MNNIKCVISKNPLFSFPAIGLTSLLCFSLLHCSFAQDDKQKKRPDTTKKGTFADSPARQFINQGESLLAEGRIPEAKEALKTAIRLDPMNTEAWGIYDRAAESLYTTRLAEDKTNPIFEGLFKPIFSFDRVETYYSFGNLYLVGQLKNISGTLKSQIELSAILFDENRQELRRATASLPLKDRGLFPNETSFFEIPFSNPPKGINSFRVRVSNFE